MPTWMTHPRHGRTPAIGAEIEWNQKNGWTIEPEKPAKPKPAVPEKTEAQAKTQKSGI